VLEEASFATCSRDSCVADVMREGRAWRVLATRSTASIDWRDLVRSCAASDIAVSDRWLPRHCTPRWLKLDRDSLARTGGVAIYLVGRPRVVTVADELGQHPWALSPPSAMRSRGR
jgi:competence protein ComEC